MPDKGQSLPCRRTSFDVPNSRHVLVSRLNSNTMRAMDLVFVVLGTATIHTLTRATLVTKRRCNDCTPLPDTGKNPGFSGNSLLCVSRGVG